ncbi:MAG: HDOD domain-containing protein [Desulfamplus sp.]|nr:HDOD domain-containing protein [Desulfamplus sp.]MBF0388660.1 HDOD domain-containing protein [Desulfamplus sp.]
MDIFVGRQPILNQNKKTYAYELLFRDSLKNSFPGIDGDTGTSRLLANTFFSMGISEITGNHPGFINFTKELILNRTPLLFPKESIVIEILENIEPDKDIEEAIKEFRKKGYKVALDDFVFDKKYTNLIKLSNIIKFDLMATPLNTIEGLVKTLKNKFNITLLAEKVETYEEFSKAKEMGFSLFQGYFFSKPEVISKTDIPSSKMALLKLISETGKKDINFNKLSQTIKNDVAISYKLMKFINSPYFRRANKINTVKDAVSFLGEDTIRQFVRVLAAAGLNDNKPDELMRLSVVRARMCELMGNYIKTPFTAEELFTMGLFSTIDAMLDKDMKTVLTEISFSKKVSDGLLKCNKEFNQLLSLCACFENGAWGACALPNDDENKELTANLPSIYMDALKMADNFLDMQ